MGYPSYDTEMTYVPIAISHSVLVAYSFFLTTETSPRAIGSRFETT